MSDPLDGIWYSSVGSVLKLEINGKTIGGVFSSKQNPDGGYYSVNGSIDPDTTLANRALSFSVAWFNEKNPNPGYRSVTSYTGQYHQTAHGECINTTFLMVDETSPANEYASTYIGFDNFCKKEYTEEEIRRELLTRMPSYHIPL
ncbi:MAG: avidin/streptavidin family protein [Candidatus Omnitrophota bacterium]